MLVLARKENERVWVGDQVIVTVTEIRHGQVKLGFTAPDGVTILREEVKLREEARYELGPCAALVPLARPAEPIKLLPGPAGGAA